MEDFESGKGGTQTGTLARIRDALEGEGAVFIDGDNKLGPGMRLRVMKRKR